jgi:hypothetical protein
MLRLLGFLFRLLVFGRLRPNPRPKYQITTCERGMLDRRAEPAAYCGLGLCSRHCEDNCCCLKALVTSNKEVQRQLS